MDELNELVSPETQAMILQILALVSLLLPFAEKLVERTENKVDDRIVAGLKTVLGIIPRVKLGAKK
jgi:hypothetical protein